MNAKKAKQLRKMYRAANAKSELIFSARSRSMVNINPERALYKHAKAIRKAES